jgi:tRNA(fMet)-specific endonuclease VapC
MILFDTDTTSLLVAGHPGVKGRLSQTTDEVAITVITRIEILLGRFAFLLKAADGEQLKRAQAWLDESDRALATLEVVPINEAAAAVFDKLRQNKKLKKIGRGDLLIGSIALALDVTLVTRNLRDFRLIPGLSAENWAD